MKCQSLFSGKNKEKSKCRLLKFYTACRALKFLLFSYSIVGKHWCCSSEKCPQTEERSWMGRSCCNYHRHHHSVIKTLGPSIPVMYGSRALPTSAIFNRTLASQALARCICSKIFLSELDSISLPSTKDMWLL